MHLRAGLQHGRGEVRYLDVEIFMERKRERARSSDTNYAGLGSVTEEGRDSEQCPECSTRDKFSGPESDSESEALAILIITATRPSDLQIRVHKREGATEGEGIANDRRRENCRRRRVKWQQLRCDEKSRARGAAGAESKSRTGADYGDKSDRARQAITLQRVRRSHELQLPPADRDQMR